MCIKCVRKSKRLGLPPGKTYGEIKALAQSFWKHFSVGLYADRRINIGVEAHFHKILQANTNKKRYNRQRGKKIDG